MSKQHTTKRFSHLRARFILARDVWWLVSKVLQAFAAKLMQHFFTKDSNFLVIDGLPWKPLRALRKPEHSSERYLSSSGELIFLKV